MDILRSAAGVIAGALKLPAVFIPALVRGAGPPSFTAQPSLKADAVPELPLTDVELISQDGTRLHAVVDNGSKRVAGKRPIVFTPRDGGPTCRSSLTSSTRGTPCSRSQCAATVRATSPRASPSTTCSIAWRTTYAPRCSTCWVCSSTASRCSSRTTGAQAWPGPTSARAWAPASGTWWVTCR